MTQTQSISYHQFTLRFITSFKNRRPEVVSALDETTTTQEFISRMLPGKDFTYQYAKFMNQRAEFNKVFKKLRMIDQSLSQSEYQSQIQDLVDDIDNKFDLDDTHKVNVGHRQTYTQGKSASKQNEKGKKQQAQDQNDSEEDQKQEKPYSRKNCSEQRAIGVSKIKATQTYDQIEKSYQQKYQSNTKQVKSTQKMVIEKDFPILNVQLGKAPTQRTFLAYQVIVQVRFLETSVDYEKYNSNGYILKQCLQKYLRKYLTENMIIVNTKMSEIKLWTEQIEFVKSLQAGNYRFNPLCDVLQVWIKRTNHAEFDCDFSVNGNMLQLKINPNKIQASEWNKQLMKLKAKSSIQQLVKYVCQKRQATDQLCKTLVKDLKDRGGAKVVQDLYAWEKSDYNRAQVKTTYAFEIIQLIDQIKDSFNQKTEKSMDQKRKKCIKVSNSHKILRYIVYKLEGQSGLRNIAWLNMQNLVDAVEIVRNQIHNKELLDQLQDYFQQFVLDPHGKPLAFSRGVILFGPPGTGKTVLTESLPNIIGFHLIQKGLSAADFMKSLVGQTSRMIKALVNRAAISPYLLCSIGIDQVDGLVPDRKDKDEKNKGEGISILLSLIGGNKDVPNLVYMTSTNYIKKIDEAISRRLNGKFQVGRPNPDQRKKIIQQRVDYLQDKQQLLNHLIFITTNFTGAALGGLSNSLLKSLGIKRKKLKSQELTKDEITKATIVVARQFNITLGIYTLPQIYLNQSDKKFLFTQTFIKRVSKHFVLVKHLKDDEFSMVYANQIQKFVSGKLKPIYQKEDVKITIQMKSQSPLDSFIDQVSMIFEEKNYDIKCFKSSQQEGYQKFYQKINDFLAERQKNVLKKTLVIMEDHPKYLGQTKFIQKFFERNHLNLYLIYYVSPENDWEKMSSALFGSKQNNQNKNNSINKENYSGRIMVELNNQTRMAFQLKKCSQKESKAAFRLFLKSEENDTPKTVIPELVEFFTKQQVSYLLLINYQLLLQNDAFEQKKILEVMEQKMLQAKTYKRSAVIIDVDSMILLNQSASDSNFGRSMSYSIQDYKMLQIIVNYMGQFASTNGDDSRWLTMIIKDSQLINIVKKKLSWPKYPEEIQKDLEQKILNQQRRCFRCNVFYTQRQNREERKCMQHPGSIIDTLSNQIQDRPVQQVKAEEISRKRKDKNLDQNRYVYACCFKGLNEQGQCFYRHITEEEFQKNEDALYNEKKKRKQEWKKKLQFFKA